MVVVWLALRPRIRARVALGGARPRESALWFSIARPRQSAPSPRIPRVRIVRAGPSGPHGAEFPRGYRSLLLMWRPSAAGLLKQAWTG